MWKTEAVAGSGLLFGVAVWYLSNASLSKEEGIRETKDRVCFHDGNLYAMYLLSQDKAVNVSATLFGFHSTCSTK